jgi:hypothetical protein
MSVYLDSESHLCKHLQKFSDKSAEVVRLAEQGLYLEVEASSKGRVTFTSPPVNVTPDVQPRTPKARVNVTPPTPDDKNPGWDE